MSGETPCTAGRAPGDTAAATGEALIPGAMLAHRIGAARTASTVLLALARTLALAVVVALTVPRAPTLESREV